MSVTRSLTLPSTRSASQDVAALRQVLAAVDAESCPRKYNFHLHTVCSDGQLHPEALVEQAIAIGLRGLAVTDHHTVAGARRAQRWLERMGQEAPRRSLPQLWWGMEITADLAGVEVHILAYAFDPEASALQPYLQGDSIPGARAEAVIAAIHEAGGLAVLAHPERYTRSARQLVPSAVAFGIDGLESYYAYRNVSPWRPSPTQTRQVEQLSREYGLLNTCGTDTHGLDILRRL